MEEWEIKYVFNIKLYLFNLKFISQYKDENAKMEVWCDKIGWNKEWKKEV